MTLLKQLGFKGVPSSILFPIHEGSALVVDHVISVHVTESSEYCELKCYLEDDCMSINIEPKGDGTYYYELSDQTMLYILEIWKIGKTLSTDQCR